MKYEEHIDIMKGLAIVLVVVGHLIQKCVIGCGVQNAVYQWIYCFHMGLFFFCSGYLSKWQDFSKGVMPIWQTLKKKALRLLVPYFTWG